MKKHHFGLIGFPVTHTMSPFIHKELFRIGGIDADYRAFSLSAEELSQPQTQEKLRELDGFNVTIPHKKEIISILDQMDPKAELASSVNTVKRENERLLGYTTDGEGFLAALHAGGIQPGGKALILGSGGVSRVMAFELADAAYFPDLTICVRESGLSSAHALAESLTEKLKKEQKTFEVQVCLYEELHPEESYALAVNGTPAGMHPNIHTIPPIPPELFKNIHAVFDAVYNPQHTPFLQKAREADCVAVGGMDMLVWQAAAAHKIWYGAQFDPEQIAEISAKAVIEMHRLFGEPKG